MKSVPGMFVLVPVVSPTSGPDLEVDHETAHPIAVASGLPIAMHQHVPVVLYAHPIEPKLHWRGQQPKLPKKTPSSLARVSKTKAVRNEG